MCVVQDAGDTETDSSELPFSGPSKDAHPVTLEDSPPGSLRRTRTGTDTFKHIQQIRRALADLHDKLPEELLLFLPALYVTWFRIKAPDRSSEVAHSDRDQLGATPA